MSDNSPRIISPQQSVKSWLENAQFPFKTWTTWRRLLVYINCFSAAQRYQRPIACYYENYLAYFHCGFLGGNENFAEIRAGSLSRLAALPLDFASALCSNFQKDWFQTRRQFTWLFRSSYTLHLRSHSSDCISTEPPNLSFAFTSKLNTLISTQRRNVCKK